METVKQEIVAQVAANVIEDTLKAAWNKVKKFFDDADAKDAIDYGDAYEEYLRNTKSKYSKIKTLIYRRVPKDLYSFYECIGVRCNRDNIDTTDVNNLLDVSNKIIVTGTGGIGKSTLFKHLFLNTIENTCQIPVLVELRSFNNIEVKDISVRDAIYNNLLQNGFTLSEEYYEYSMKMGGYVILFDGFDEVNRDRVRAVAEGIRAICSQYGENYYMVSSRPSESFIGWNEFTEMTAQSLTKEQALSLIEKIEFEPSVKQSFYKELKDHLYTKYQSFASNPLLLTIMLLTYNDHAVFPERLNDFYEQAFSTLFNMHDATKESYVRDIRSDLGCEDFKTIFSYICFKSYFGGEFEFTEPRLREHIQKAKEKFPNIKFAVDDYQEDLTLSVCMLVKEGLVYRFSHRSFQEYFAALYTCKLPDEVQKKLLVTWMKESNASTTDSYLEMLFNMQGEKVNKLVFAPGIKEIKKYYDETGFTIDFLEIFFEGIRIREPSASRPNGAISLIIGNGYLCSVMMLTCRLNNYPYYGETAEKEKEVIDQLSAIDPKRKYTRTIDFDKAVEAVGVDSLLDTLKWFEKQVVFAIKVLQKTENIAINNKKRVASILDSL